MVSEFDDVPLLWTISMCSGKDKPDFLGKFSMVFPVALSKGATMVGCEQLHALVSCYSHGLQWILDTGLGSYAMLSYLILSNPVRKRQGWLTFHCPLWGPDCINHCPTHFMLDLDETKSSLIVAIIPNRSGHHIDFSCFITSELPGGRTGWLKK